MTNPVSPIDIVGPLIAGLVVILYLALFIGAIIAVVMVVRALRTMATELTIMNSTLASGINDLSEDLQAIRQAVAPSTTPDERPPPR